MKASLAITAQFAKLNGRQSMFAVKLPNLTFTKCITPTVASYTHSYTFNYASHIQQKIIQYQLQGKT